jgi:hypothetical protein
MRAYVALYYMGMNPLFFLQLCFPMPITWFLICDYLYCNFVAAGLFLLFSRENFVVEGFLDFVALKLR